MRVRPTFEWMARIGYAARGVVFLILRTFAALAALDTKDALRSLVPQLFGHSLLFRISEGAFARITAPLLRQAAGKTGLASR